MWALAAAGCSGDGRPAATPTEAVEATEGARPAERPASAEESLKEKLRVEAARLRRRLGDSYVVGVEEPFVVAGEIDEQTLRRIMRSTIRACSRRMYAQFFDKKPDYVLTVYLFADDRSYRRAAKSIWGDTDVSRFGYYKPGEKTLVMNISTGTGTLVHEMFHALVEPDFPKIPTWLNEGVASLYECCRLEENRLVGMMNWRFPRLKKAVDEGGVVPLEKLVATTRRRFYGAGRDLHYAEARYFCMYLQEKGLLERFYKTFRDRRKEDPTGAKFLEELLGKDLDAVQSDWLAWVRSLPDAP